jgi:hypothetical protein
MSMMTQRNPNGAINLVLQSDYLYYILMSGFLAVFLFLFSLSTFIYKHKLTRKDIDKTYEEIITILS